jgi:hypothetical protein
MPYYCIIKENSLSEAVKLGEVITIYIHFLIHSLRLSKQKAFTTNTASINFIASNSSLKNVHPLKVDISL